MSNNLNVSKFSGAIGTSLSIIFNSILLILIYKFSRPEYGSYRILMMVMTFMYIMYSTIELIILPSYFVYEYNYLLFTTNIVEFQRLSQVLIITFCALFACIQVVLASQFVYRFLSVAGIHYLREKFFSGKRHIVWIACVIGCFWIWFISAFLVFANDGNYPKELEIAIRETFGRDIREMAFTLVTYAQLDDEGNVKLVMFKIYMILFLIVCAAIPMTISLVCGLKTWLKIRDAASMVRQSFRLQKQERQLFYALLIQFTIPFVGNTLPMLVLFLCPAFHISPEPYTNYLCILVAFYPIFDALATVIIIKDYYRGVLKMFYKTKDFSSSGTAVQVPNNTLHTDVMKTF